MNYFWAFLGWMWSRKLFFLTIFLSAILFAIWFFPFSDLSDVVTTKVAQATNGQVYLQFDQLDLHLIPQPAISATKLSVETSLPPIEAKWAKFTPSLFNALFSIPSVIKAAGGDPEAARTLTSKLGASIDAEGVFGGDISLRLKPGAKSEGGRERSRVSLAVEKMNLGDVQKWSEMPVKLQGQLNVDTDMQFTPDFSDQPDGEYLIKISKFVLPGGTFMLPFEGAVFPMTYSTLTLANVVLKGHLSGGRLLIEEGTFGQNKDPMYGRIKGHLFLRFQAMGPNIVPLPGQYDLTLELTTNQTVEKELSLIFALLGPGKTATPGGGAHYLVRAQGAGFGMMAAPPMITRATSF
jgi:hypothetical protein